MTLTEGVPVAEGSQLSLAPKQKASETQAWGPGPREARGAENKSKTDRITSQDPKLHPKLPGTVADQAQPGTPETKSTMVYLFDFKVGEKAEEIISQQLNAREQTGSGRGL